MTHQKDQATGAAERVAAYCDAHMQWNVRDILSLIGEDEMLKVSDIRELLAENANLKSANLDLEKNYMLQVRKNDLLTANVNMVVKCNAQLTGKDTQHHEVAAILREVDGCFDAADVEGLGAALAITDDHWLKDVIERRVLPARQIVKDAIAQLGARK